MTSLLEGLDATSPPPEVVSKAAFAEEIGVSKPRVSQLVKQGLPLTENGKVRRADALDWYQKTIAPNRRKAFAEKSSGDARSQLDSLKIQRERMSLAKDRGELIDRETASKTVFARARMERDAWLALATRVAPKLALELDTDSARLFAALDREIREQLATLASQPVEGLGDA